MLVCRFRKRLPEFDLDVALDVGVETLALVGRSGSGKSTTLNVVAGLTAPDDGTVVLAGRTLVDVAWRISAAPEQRRIGYLFQNYALFPHLSVADNIAFGLFRVPRAERDARVRRTLDFLELRNVEGARPATLSGGERQRVALARAIVTEPGALLLDEPLAALDVEHRARIRLELRDVLRRLAIPVIVVSHDFDDARVLGDRIAAMDRGQIVQSGSSRALADQPADEFVAALTGTNLATISHNGSIGERVAFDPWSARISKEASAEHYEWQGPIIDVRRLGAHVRVTVRCPSSIKVDVGSGEVEAAGFRVGDIVFVSVPSKDVRRT